jgi:hypothetical protein
MSTAFDLYEAHLAAARERFRERSEDLGLFDRTASPDFVELFLIHFCALGVQMTRPVEGWITRAGEACLKLDYTGLGRALLKHARHEAGHEVMMEQDAAALVRRWNARHGHRLDAAELMGLPPTPGIRNYVDLHESVIAGPEPFGQIAIEYEIERLSITIGTRLMETFVAVLGEAIADDLSFLRSHIVLDEGHTQFNAAQMQTFLDEHPNLAEPLIRTGTAALEAYGDFLEDCANLARRMLTPHPARAERQET